MFAKLFLGMVFGDTLIGYLFVWMIEKFAEAEKKAEREFQEMRFEQIRSKL